MSAFYWGYSSYLLLSDHSLDDVYNTLVSNSSSIFTAEPGTQFHSDGTGTSRRLHAFTSGFRVSVLCPPAFSQSTSEPPAFYMVVAVSGDGAATEAQALLNQVTANIKILAADGTIFEPVS